MFTIQDLNSIDTRIFNIVDRNAYTVTVQSKRTGHCWLIMNRSFQNRKDVAIFKTLIHGSEYHHKSDAKDFEQALSIIRQDDQIAQRKASCQHALTGSV